MFLKHSRPHRGIPHNGNFGFLKYKTLKSFQEYLLIDPYNCRMESRFREEPDLWRESIVTKMDQNITLKSVGCELQLSDVYRHIKFK